MSNPACRHCGESLEENCVGEGCGRWEPVDRPEGCVCDPRDWQGEIRRACSKFTKYWENTCDCGHERECHEGEE